MIQLLLLSLIGPTFGADVPCDAGFAAYKKTVFPFVREKCVACHDQPAKGPKQGPAHSVADEALSYKKMLKYLDSKKVEDMTLVVSGGDGHCIGYGVDCGVKVETILPVVQEWMTLGQDKCAVEVKNVSAAVALPTDLPTVSKGFRAIEIPLTGMNEILKGAVLRIEAQSFLPPEPGTTNGAYRFRKPRLILTGTTSLRVKGLKIYLNGKWDPKNTSLLSIDQVVNAKSAEMRQATGDSGGPLLSNVTQIVLRDGTANETIAFGFNSIEAVPARKCALPDVFATMVAPIVESRACLECHGLASAQFPEARRDFLMKSNDAELCDEFLSRANSPTGRNSSLLRYATGRVSTHLPSIFLEPEIEAISSWIEAERKKMSTDLLENTFGATHD